MCIFSLVWNFSASFALLIPWYIIVAWTMTMTLVVFYNIIYISLVQVKYDDGFI